MVWLVLISVEWIDTSLSTCTQHQLAGLTRDNRNMTLCTNIGELNFSTTLYARL